MSDQAVFDDILDEIKLKVGHTNDILLQNTQTKESFEPSYREIEFRIDHYVASAGLKSEAFYVALEEMKRYVTDKGDSWEAIPLVTDIVRTNVSKVSADTDVYPGIDVYPEIREVRVVTNPEENKKNRVGKGKKFSKVDSTEATP
ncbi:MAG: hypothetical protein ACMG6E_03710, partial [Candidatus Roizmanbacteria bacterium]